jgi:hypothetical protein
MEMFRQLNCTNYKGTMDSAEWNVARLYMALRFIKRTETPAQLHRRGIAAGSSSSDSSAQQQQQQQLQQQQPPYSSATAAAAGGAASSTVQQPVPVALGKTTVSCNICA